MADWQIVDRHEKLSDDFHPCEFPGAPQVVASVTSQPAGTGGATTKAMVGKRRLGGPTTGCPRTFLHFDGAQPGEGEMRKGGRSAA